MLTLGSTKNCCVNKKIFHIEVNVAQQNYKSQKNMLWRKKIYVTPKRRLTLTKYVKCCTEKVSVFTKNGACCI